MEFAKHILELAMYAGASMLFLAVVFIPLEKVFPAKLGQKTFRPAWLTDAFFFYGQYLIWNGAVLWVLTYFADGLDSKLPMAFREAIGNQAWWLQMIEVIVLSDFLIYWAHRLQHKVGFLWRFHAVHHSAEHLDWLAAHREHPLDSIYTVGIINLPAFLLGFDLATIEGLIAFRGIWAIYIHSNVRLPIGPIRMLIGAPELHHWHHDKDRQAGNYANISPLMDIIFGTYTCPDHEPESFGIHEPTPKSYIGQLLHPIGLWPKLEASEVAAKEDNDAE